LTWIKPSFRAARILLFVVTPCRKLPWTALAALCIALAIGIVPQVRAQGGESVSQFLQRMLSAAQPPSLQDRDLPKGLATLRALYDRRGFAPVWQRSGRPTAQALRLVQALRDAPAYGLDPSDYDADSIGAQMRELVAARDAQGERWAALDLRLSGAALKFATHLHYGRVDPRAVGFKLPVPRSDLDPIGTIERLAADDTAAVLAALEPPFNHYRLLKAASAKYRRLAADGEPTALPAFAGRSVKPGAHYSGAAALRWLLVALGDLSPESVPASSDETLDAALVAALRNFQERHGLAADGILGRQTFAALTVPLERRARQIELTLERWRWLPAFETPPIVVNVPQFRLFAFRTTEDRESDMLRMDVIVGQDFPETQTPVFLAEMKYVVFQPYWDVPDTIVQREMLAQIRGNPRFFERNRMELVRGRNDDSPVVPPTPENIEALAAGVLRVRQQPGRGNALGAIKFVLPNSHSVYLHATPERHLFRKSSRAFSHGCIRLGDPVALAEHVLRNARGDWTTEKIEEAMKGEPNRRVNLSKPIQVMILYGTAIATESGQVRFFEDIYEHDKKLDELLRARNDRLTALPRPEPDAPRVEMQKIRARIKADPAALQR
jgi:murein L,D-transpeptidase YcbB/YkuD